MRGSPDAMGMARAARGSSLPLLMILLAMLAMLATQALTAVRTDLAMAAGLAESQRAFALAEQGLAERAAGLPWSTTEGCTPAPPWQHDEAQDAGSDTWSWRVCLLGEASQPGSEPVHHYRLSVRARAGEAVAEHHRGWIQDSNGDRRPSFWHTGPGW